LANVSMTQVAAPEPASMTLMVTGIAGLIGVVRRRRSSPRDAQPSI